MSSTKEWTRLFKALANENRLNILKLLAREGELSVSAISGRIKNGIKNTSKHLIYLNHLDILEANGKQRSVWYRLSPSLRPELKLIIDRFLK